LDAQKALRDKQLANAKELADFATRRAESGEVSGLEAAQFELEANQVAVETLQLEAEKIGVLGELRPLLGLGSEKPFRLIGALASPQPSAPAPSVESRPEYQAAEQNERAAAQGIELEKARRRDDFSAGFFAGAERSEDAPDGLQNDGLIGFRVSIPLPLWNKNEGKIQEASATAARLRQEKEALAVRLTTEAGAARSKMQALAKLVSEIDKSLLPQSAALEEKLRGYYSSGQTSLTEVLRARDKRLQLERTRLEVLRDYHLAQASLGLGLN
jgi:cobalt-zinc-cadmium efflux system outer membrane protein